MLFSGYVAQSDWLEERSVSFLLSFSLSVFPFLFSRCRNRESSTKRRGLFRWLSARKENDTLSIGGSPPTRKTATYLSIGGSLRRHLSLPVAL
ncbi:hypothetical protein Bca4012_095779 [Brassica carinata]